MLQVRDLRRRPRLAPGGLRRRIPGFRRGNAPRARPPGDGGHARRPGGPAHERHPARRVGRDPRQAVRAETAEVYQGRRLPSRLYGPALHGRTGPALPGRHPVETRRREAAGDRGRPLQPGRLAAGRPHHALVRAGQRGGRDAGHRGHTLRRRCAPQMGRGRAGRPHRVAAVLRRMAIPARGGLLVHRQGRPRGAGQTLPRVRARAGPFPHAARKGRREPRRSRNSSVPRRSGPTANCWRRRFSTSWRGPASRAPPSCCNTASTRNAPPPCCAKRASTASCWAGTTTTTWPANRNGTTAPIWTRRRSRTENRWAAAARSSPAAGRPGSAPCSSSTPTSPRCATTCSSWIRCSHSACASVGTRRIPPPARTTPATAAPSWP